MVFFSALSPPADTRHKQDNTEVYVNGNCLRHGTIYIAESQLFWINGEGFGFSVEYPSITVHAISKDLNSFPHECLYLVLDTQLPGSGDSGDGVNSTEIRFVPSDKSSLTAMFQATSACQRLHPDRDVAEEDEFEDENEEDYVNEDDINDRPEDDQAVIYPAGGAVDGVVLFEGGGEIPVYPRGVNILADDDVAVVEDIALVGRSNGEDGALSNNGDTESEAMEDVADQFEDAECDS